ncbi:hypothetical protein BDW42DRAFT_169462 [Aspergillus taichungensis]|uniref:Peroxin 26 n=1 Tax=Aspergillus taichungensis TaxID=482145 RepID=A0A2J5HVF8_9EURO|nr:hypothetical protein BDW42DRAFT_169462 [Aspergillus taichungensis]
MAESSHMSASQLSSSSSSSLSPSKLCSKTYKKASQLYLTRRLQESLTALEPVITATATDDQLLSAIVELGPEEGKRSFGQKEWKAISSSVREGGIWETVVQTGYQGLEGSVDAEVVYNLATLILNHCPSQTLNQQRLETYLSSYGQPNLDVAEHIRNSPSQRGKFRVNGGTDTPKDLEARVRIIELFTLHVLPRNDEWEYAQEFINLSEVLDEENKDVFLQTLEGLKEEREQGELRAAALQREKDAQMEREAQVEERRRADELAAAERAHHNNNNNKASSRSKGEAEKSRPNGSSLRGKKVGDKPAGSKSGSSAGRTAFSPPGSKNVKKSEKPERARSTQALSQVLRNLYQYIVRTVAGNPLSFARTLLFLLGIVVALSRQNVRERIRRLTGSGWQKVKGTVGMGVKVSYI